MSIQYRVRVIFKGVWRDSITYFRYKAQLYGMFLEMVSLIFGFLLIGGAYNFSPEVLSLSGLKSTDVFMFIMTGASLQVLSGIATWGPLNRVEEDIHFGTLEHIFVTPANRIGYLLSTTISRALFTMIFFVPFFILALVLSGSITNIAAIGLSLVAVLISILSMMSVGIFFALLGIMFRQTRALVSILHMLIQFLCGAYLPVQGFVFIGPGIGPALKYIAMCFPFTYCFDILRAFMIGPTYITLLPVWLELVIVAAMTIAFVVIARLFLIPVERKAKRNGLSIL
ncbi:MAG: ABC transporter permease [Candidatus Heimdallarchaeota archaeon]